MIKFNVKKNDNQSVKWLLINEGHINFDTGIRFIYQLLDENFNCIEKKLFIINGNDFDDLGKEDEGIRISILKLVLESCNSEIITKNDY